jgi:hypothetical protein
MLSLDFLQPISNVLTKRDTLAECRTAKKVRLARWSPGGPDRARAILAGMACPFPCLESAVFVAGQDSVANPKSDGGIDWLAAALRAAAIN